VIVYASAVQCYFRNRERLENGELSYSIPSGFWGISTKLSGLSRHLPKTCPDYFVFPYLKHNVFKNRPGTIPESMQVIIDNCNLIDVATLRRSFENMKRRVTLCLEAEGRHFEHLP
jgi:hypothetical protein